MKKIFLGFLLFTTIMYGCGEETVSVEENVNVQEAQIEGQLDVDGTLVADPTETPSGEAPIIEPNDPTADSSATAGGGAGCDAIAGTWVMNKYTTNISSSAGAITNIHANKGKVLTLKDDCTYTENYSTEVLNPAYVLANYTARGLSATQVSAMVGSPIENISCSYEGQNSGSFEMDYLNDDHEVVHFTPSSVNNITGTCSHSFSGLQIGGTHYTPGMGQSALNSYTYTLSGDTLTFKMLLVADAEVRVVIEFSRQ